MIFILALVFHAIFVCTVVLMYVTLTEANLCIRGGLFSAAGGYTFCAGGCICGSRVLHVGLNLD